MVCAPVFIFTSGSSALLGRPHCGLSICLSLVAIFNALFWVHVNFLYEKTAKTQKHSTSTILVSYENGRRQLLGAQSINSERTSLFYSNLPLSLIYPPLVFAKHDTERASLEKVKTSLYLYLVPKIQCKLLTPTSGQDRTPTQFYCSGNLGDWILDKSAVCSGFEIGFAINCRRFIEMLYSRRA